MFTTISAYHDCALRHVFVKSCQDMSLNIFVQCQMTSAHIGSFQAVSEWLQSTVATASQCTGKAVIEIGMAHCDVTKLRTEQNWGHRNRKTLKFLPYSRSSPARTFKQSFMMSWISVLNGISVGGAVLFGIWSPHLNARDPHDQILVFLGNCRLDFLTWQWNDHHSWVGLRLSWFDIFCYPELESYWAFPLRVPRISRCWIEILCYFIEKYALWFHLAIISGLVF
jgi:hypothetical protein